MSEARAVRWGSPLRVTLADKTMRALRERATADGGSVAKVARSIIRSELLEDRT